MDEYQIDSIKKRINRDGSVTVTYIGNNILKWALTYDDMKSRIDSKKEAFYIIDNPSGSKIYLSICKKKDKLQDLCIPNNKYNLSLDNLPEYIDRKLLKIKTMLTKSQFEKILTKDFGALPIIPNMNPKNTQKKIEYICNNFSPSQFDELIYSLKEGGFDIDSTWFHAVYSIYNGNKIDFSNEKTYALTKFSILKYILYTAFGIAIILNQLGFYFNKAYDISWLHPIWTVSLFPEIFSIGNITILFAAMMMLHCLVLFLFEGLAQSFIKGFSLGFLIIPLVAATLGIIALTIAIAAYLCKLIALVLFYIIYYIAIAISAVLSYILIPFSWLYTNLILPLVSFIFSFLKPILEIIALPLVWLYTNIFSPILQIIFNISNWILANIFMPIAIFIAQIIWWLIKYILFWPIAIVLIIILSLVISTPFYAVGLVFISTIADALLSRVNKCNLFAYGLGMGLVFFDIILNYTAIHYNLVSSVSTTFFLIYILISILFILRLTISYKQQSNMPLSLPYLVRFYFEKSKYEIILSIILIPLGFILNAFFSSDES